MSDLIDRYVWAVSERLPHDIRRDVGDELRTTIADMADARGADDESATREVLTELGDPVQLAGKYGGSPQYLIGPRFYREWLCVLKAVAVAALPVVFLVQLVVELWDPDQAVVPGVLAAAGATLEVALHIAVWTTVLFVVAERTGAEPAQMSGGNRAWSMDSLPAVPRKRQISGADLVVAVVLLLAPVFLVLWQRFRPAFRDAGGDPVPVLDPDLWSLWIPLLFVLVATNIGVEVWKYREGRWTLPLTVTNAVVDAAWVALVVTAVLAADLVNPGFTERLREAGNSWEPAAIGIVAVAIVVVICVWDLVDSLVKHGRVRRGELD